MNSLLVKSRIVCLIGIFFIPIILYIQSKKNPLNGCIIFMDKRTILLLGATGLVGGECLKLLLEDPFCGKLVTLTRTPLPESFNHPKLEPHIINFENKDSFRELAKADQVICTLGTTIKKAGNRDAFYKVDFTYPHEIGKIALENGAEHFLMVSSVGAHSTSPFFYNRVKGEVEDALQGLGYRAVSLFRPSFLLGQRNEFRFGETVAGFFSRYISFAIPKKFKPIQALTVAGAMVQVAKDNQPGARIIESNEIKKIFSASQKR